RFPQHLSRDSIERDDARALMASHIQKHSLAFDQRRTSDAKETLAGVKLAARVHAPDLFPIAELKAGDNALSAVCVNFAFENRRCGARPFIETEVIPVRHGISEFPQRCSGFAVAALNDFLVFEPM